MKQIVPKFRDFLNENKIEKLEDEIEKLKGILWDIDNANSLANPTSETAKDKKKTLNADS